MTENIIVVPNNYTIEGDYLINERTGEVEEVVIAALPEGSRILTPEQQEAIKRKNPDLQMVPEIK